MPHRGTETARYPVPPSVSHHKAESPRVKDLKGTHSCATLLFIHSTNLMKPQEAFISLRKGQSRLLSQLQRTHRQSMSPQTPRNLPPILPSHYPLNVALRSSTPPFLFPLQEKCQSNQCHSHLTLIRIWLTGVFNHVLTFILWRFRKHFYVSCGISLVHACLTHGLLGHSPLFPFFVMHRRSSNRTENRSSKDKARLRAASMRSGVWLGRGWKA